ncbi:fungal specific transcription factor domain-containing protein [Verticillium alfalfae VaMs.102]|uniref:Fungal specific transcription factor domain-containing protein n=1 Tax=Verticillium alfalfae (strain VaMs.102 / ATCC MYA-4576 / FGSC 10136) TaxID=526221 RepID=C9SNP7_VERA1|nr:fungal specific transcription factor domain-containing protein [Verticillium alfalfae VaMs.102]EEY20412.1 fungal specific transcription factor domain-containing protein [Verticillium alfalfae VaMs.102]
MAHAMPPKETVPHLPFRLCEEHCGSMTGAACSLPPLCGPGTRITDPSATAPLTLACKCDACRSRKIRCNRESPCSHCVHAKIECTHADAKPKEKRTRILLTPQYERKIDLIDRRLDGVVRLLEDLKLNWPPPTSQPLQSQTGSTSNPSPAARNAQSSFSTPSSHAAQSVPAGPVVEGDSSLAAHSVFANEFLQNVVNTGDLQGSGLELRETLNSLHHIVDALKQQTTTSEMAYPHGKPTSRPVFQTADLPPIKKAVALLRTATSQWLASTSWIFEFLSKQHFTDLCLGVYFSDDHLDTDYITVNAGLYALFLDQSYHCPPEEKEENLQYAQICKENLETALANLPLHLPASNDVLLALLFGAFHAIEISKPSLSWVLTCKASELCQTLGYHRASSMKNDKPEDREFKVFIFWSVYFIDKSLSLRLGRASTIPDWDVTVQPPDVKTAEKRALVGYFCLWIKAARCQGNTYEKLYSPDAIKQSDSVRLARVEKLVSDLEDLEVESRQTDAKWLKAAEQYVGKPLMEFFVISDEVLRLGLLTMVYRAAPRPVGSSTTFTAECINAARVTLARHQDCMVIETQDQEDLARLHAFITSIKNAPAVSDAAAKMHRLFEVLYSVALRYVEFRVSTPPAQQAQANAEMNTYLAQLGFPATAGDPNVVASNGADFGGHQPTSAAAGTFDSTFGGGLGDATMQGGNPMMWMGNTAQLEDWFYSNQQMMGLLQEPSFNLPNTQ